MSFASRKMIDGQRIISVYSSKYFMGSFGNGFVLKKYALIRITGAAIEIHALSMYSSRVGV